MKRLNYIFYILFILIQKVYSQELPMVKVPKLNGPYSVGVQSIPLVDTENIRKTRILSFYPTNDTTKNRNSLSLFSPVNKELINDWHENFNSVPQVDVEWTIQFLQNIYNSTNINAIYNAIPFSGEIFPTLFFGPGAAGTCTDYAFLLEQLSSIGLVVLCIDRPQAEMKTKLIFDTETNKYLKYEIKGKAATTLLKKYPNTTDYANYLFHLSYHQLDYFNKILGGIIDQNRIYFSGHSHGGHSAFNSSKYKLNVLGYINFDGSFRNDTDDKSLMDPDAQYYYIKILSKDLNNDQRTDFVNDGSFVENEEEWNIDIVKELKNFKIIFVDEGMDHGSVGNTPVFVDYSPKNKAYWFAQEQLGARKNSTQTYKEITEILHSIIFKLP